MTLGEACGAVAERRRAKQKQQRLTVQAVRDAVEAVEVIALNAALRAGTIAEFEPALVEGRAVDAARLRAAGMGLLILAKEWPYAGA
jgi:hypothetical protein